MTLTTRQILLASRPEAEPGPENFRIETTSLPDPGPGQALVRVIWLSLDPYMRGRMSAAKSYVPPYELGAPLTGGCVAEVIASGDPSLAPGDLVEGRLPWAEHALVPVTDVRRITGTAPLGAWLGVLGMPGMTAWTGLNRIAQQLGDVARHHVHAAARRERHDHRHRPLGIALLRTRQTRHGEQRQAEHAAATEVLERSGVSCRHGGSPGGLMRR